MKLILTFSNLVKIISSTILNVLTTSSNNALTLAARYYRVVRVWAARFSTRMDTPLREPPRGPSLRVGFQWGVVSTER